ncbi:MAG: hypothetical protein IPM98_00315 [Lewinellaceae bacterium]|nr:hypothetical protein [Lewinellaceae bacterium]
MESLHNSKQDLAAAAGASAEPAAPAPDAASLENHERLFQRGLKWLGAGIFLMAASFGINFFLYDTETSFQTSMYVLTSLGAICIMKGLVDMLGF